VVYIAFSSKGVYAVSFASQGEGEFCHQLSKREKMTLVKDMSIGKELRDDILSYLAGRRVSFSEHEIDISQSTIFQRMVWLEVKKIPYGQTRSYRWIAEQIGRPYAQRAVGHANSHNPLPLIIPCHRVIRSDGQLGGYSAGLKLKEKFLALEEKKLQR